MIDVRPEQPDDREAIAEVNRLAFGQNNEARLVAAVRNAEGFDPLLSLVALCDDRVVGHILFSPIHIETPRGAVPALALAPMAVHPDHQRQGIGSQLVRQGLDACRRLGHGIVVVVGHPDYYPRFGFKCAARFGLKAPFPAPEEAFMALSLSPHGQDGIAGTVRYPGPFEDV